MQGRIQRFYHVELHRNGNLYDLSYFTSQISNNKGADQTARMRRLVSTFVVRKQQSDGFSCRGPCDVEAHASWSPPGLAPGKVFAYHAPSMYKQQILYTKRASVAYNYERIMALPW